MVKNYKTRRASEVDSRRFVTKARQCRSAMQSACTQELWDATVSNGVHGVILTASALTARKSGEYYTGQDHGQAADYLEHIEGPEAAGSANQMRQVVDLKGLSEYESRACLVRRGILKGVQGATLLISPILS